MTLWLTSLCFGSETSPTNTVNLGDLARHPEEWPASVKLTQPLLLRLSVLGQDMGETEARAGMTLKLVQVLGDQIVVLRGEATNTIPVHATDLVSRVAEKRRNKADPSYVDMDVLPNHKEEWPFEVQVVQKNALGTILIGERSMGPSMLQPNVFYEVIEIQTGGKLKLRWGRDMYLADSKDTDLIERVRQRRRERAEVAMADLTILAQEPDRWPSNVMMRRPLHSFKTVDGKEQRTHHASRGEKVTLVEVLGDTITVEHNGSKLTIPADWTDLAGQIVAANNAKTEEAKKDESRGRQEVVAQKTGLDLVGLSRIARPSVVLLEVFDATRKLIATGTGFLVSPDGKVISNFHVIEKAVSVLAKTQSGAKLKVAGVLSEDRDSDLALLQLSNVSDLPFLPLGSSTSMKAGYRVAVIGSPLGLEGTLTEGIVSAIRDTPIQTGMATHKWVQITAAISPGSSGSPVLSAQGDVIGIATLVLRGGQALNFAVPSELAREMLANNTNTLPRSLVVDIKESPKPVAIASIPNIPSRTQPSGRPEVRYTLTGIAEDSRSIENGACVRIEFDGAVHASEVKEGLFLLEIAINERELTAPSAVRRLLHVRIGKDGRAFLDRLQRQKKAPGTTLYGVLDVVRFDDGTTKPCLCILGSKKNIGMGGETKYSW